MPTRRENLELALAEAVHRARNDLQAVSAMLRLQASAASNPAARDALAEAGLRVQALSALNTRLDGHAKGVTSFIDSETFLKGLAADIRVTHFGDRPIMLRIEAAIDRIPTLEAKPLGLIINELVINAMKYAFPDNRPGTVSILFQRDGGDNVLVVKDDGVGIDLAAPAKGTGIGTRIVKALITQISGVFNIRPGEAHGTECVIRWPASGP